VAAIAAEREAVQKVFAGEFPDYAALSRPQPLTLKEIQSLLSDDEALVLFSVGEKESFVFAVTRKAFGWKPIALGAQMLSAKVGAFRHGRDVAELRKSAAAGNPVLFDLALAHELHGTLLGPVDELIKDKRHLLVVPSGPLTSLPFQLLLTEAATTAPQ